MSVHNPYLDIWEKKIPNKDEFQALTALEKLKLFVWFGHLAANSHNTQPWRFELFTDSFSVKVYVDRSTILPESDVSGRQSVISVGCAVQNIIISSGAYGFSAVFQDSEVEKNQVKPSTNPPNQYILLGSIIFSPQNKCNDYYDSLLPAITTRRVMRAEFDPSLPVPDEVIKEMLDNIPKDLVTTHMVTDAFRRLAISEFQGQADGYVLNSPRFARELGDWFLPNDIPTPLGMPGNTFGFDDVQSRRIHEGLRGQTNLEPEDMLRFSLGGKVGFEKSPLLCFFTIKRDDIPFWISAGRAMQLAFLILEKHQLSYAVHAAIVEVRLVNRIFATTLGTSEPLASVFRVGYLKDNLIKEHRPHSPRMPIDNVIISLGN